jgi:hypothetical protein
VYVLTRSTNRDEDAKMTTAQTLDIAKLKKERQIVVFRSFERANSWIARERGQTIVLGDEGEYWVCTMKLGARLVDAGYEFAPVTGR